MTTVSGKEFLTKLMTVVKKLEVLANTQGYRFKTKTMPVLCRDNSGTGRKVPVLRRISIH